MDYSKKKQDKKKKKKSQIFGVTGFVKPTDAGKRVEVDFSYKY